MSFPDVKTWVCLPLLLLSLTNCSGDLSLNSEQIQEIVKNIPDENYGTISLGPSPVYVIQVPKNELLNLNKDSQIHIERKIISTDEYDHFIIDLNRSEPDPLLNVDPNDIESIDIKKDAGTAAKFNATENAGVVFVRFKKGTIQKLSKTK